MSRKEMSKTLDKSLISDHFEDHKKIYG